jgi:YD repeat-containing protein
MAPDAGGDSLHVGLDGAAPSAAADLTGFTNEWGWSRVTPSGDATLDLTATGEHTLETYMREDGLRVDRVLLVTDTNYIPSGLGPAESLFDTITKTIPGGLGTTSIAYGYDALYRLTGTDYSGNITATFAYVYDSVGNMTAFTETVDAQTTSVTRSFDGANRLEYAVDASGTTTYTYDSNGNLVELLPPGATVANPVGGLRYAYDQRNLMVGHETNPDGTAWVLQAEYVYDGANDRLQQVDYTGATPITTTYTNDVVRRETASLN